MAKRYPLMPSDNNEIDLLGEYSKQQKYGFKISLMPD